VIQIVPHLKVLVAYEPVDFRKGIDSLAGVCRLQFQVDPFTGTLFVFRNRSGTALKLLVYDGPPEEFAKFLALAVSEWTAGKSERADYAAAYATDVAVDGKKKTKPTAFHFTAANQQFLGAVESVRRIVTREWAERSLHRPGQTIAGLNLR
jgi:hypothetical protein